MADQQHDVKKTKTRTLLTNKREVMRTSSRAGVRLEKIPESTLTMSKGGHKTYSVEPSNRGAEGGQLNEELNASMPLTLKN